MLCLFFLQGSFELSISSFDDDEHLGVDFIDKSVLNFNAKTFPPLLSNQESYFRSIYGAVSTTNLTIRYNISILL